MKATQNETIWARFGKIQEISYLGKDILGIYGGGCHVKFVDTNTFKETLFTANMPSKYGDGIKTVGCHRSIYVFAYSENCLNADLIIRTFPDFRLVQKITEGPQEGYKAISFTETALLVALGDAPLFTTYVFNWRTGEKFAQHNSNLILENQVLRCNWTKPINFAQLGRQSKKLLVWNVLPCGKQTILTNHEVTMQNVIPLHMPILTNMIWTTDDTLLVTDVRGNVYLVNQEYSLEKLIDANIEGENDVLITWFKGGLAVAGPNNEIRHYKKSGVWSYNWAFPLKTGLKHILAKGTDYLCCITNEDEVMKYDKQEGLIPLHKKIKHIVYHFQDFCLIYPESKVAAVITADELLVVEVGTGDVMKRLALSGNPCTIIENPVYPYVIIGFQEGHLDLISLFEPSKPRVMISFNLIKIPIQIVYFFEEGKLFVAGNKDTGKLFVIEGLPGSKMNIIAYINVERQIVDYTMVTSNNRRQIFVILVTSKYLAGNKILRYSILNHEDVEMKEYEFEDEEQLYYRIIVSDKSHKDIIFYALSLLSRDIHVLEANQENGSIKLSSTIKSGHQMRKLDLSINSRFAITWGFDGFIFVRCKDFEKQVGMVVTHHRNCGGVKKAYIDKLGNNVISLGKENLLTCSKIVTVKVEVELEDNQESASENSLNFEIENKDEDELNSSAYTLMFKRPTLGYEPEERLKDKTWLEIQEILQLEKEEQSCEIERASIIQEFEDIKSILVDLVTKNETGPENENLDLGEFYLDSSLLTYKQNKNKEQIKNREVCLKALIVAQDKVSEHLKTNYLDVMYKSPTYIRGIFHPSKVDSYGLLPPDEHMEKRFKWVVEMRKVHRVLELTGTFHPWIPLPLKELSLKISAPLSMPTEDYREINLTDVSLTKSVDTQVAIAGSLTQLFIDRSPLHYTQRELTTFYQTALQQTTCEYETIKLKTRFNQKYEAMREEKRKKMEYVIENNALLRHIISEYNYFLKNKITLKIEDPEWAQDERPELITQVLDGEVGVTPYISPSEQAILDAKAAEEEKIRLAILADNFKEEALMSMMNGVLEVKWEDELKHEVPIPKCVLQKEPSEYNAEDLKIAKDYQEKVDFLNSERQRYHQILEEKFTKTSKNLIDCIRNFNKNLADLIDYKFSIDAALHQENMIVNRTRLLHNSRIEFLDKQKGFKDKITKNEQRVEKISEDHQIISEFVADFKTSLDNLQNKEKILEKAFRKDIQEISPILQEQAIKLYRKRPKVGYRQVTTVSELIELAKGITSGEIPIAMTSDSLEYLKAVDQLDQATAIPPSMDESSFNLVCKHRRLRIDYEIRVRAAQERISDCEISLAFLQKRSHLNKEKNVKLSGEINKIREEYSNLIHNTTVQFVLPKGLVEIPLTGDLMDFDDAILVPKKEIYEVNRLIKAAGEKKLLTITQNMNFRRNIMATEWEHRKLRMIMNDLLEQINDINSVRLTKEMRLYLEKQTSGGNTNTKPFEKEMEVTAVTYGKIIKERKDKFQEIKTQITNYKEHNAYLDNTIKNVNMDLCDLKIQQDLTLVAKENELFKSRMEVLLKRSALVQQIQKNHQEVLVLQTELELLRQPICHYDNDILVKDMRAYYNKTIWAKFGKLERVVCVGKDTICYYGGGCHLKFINVNTGEAVLFTANMPSIHGDGIKAMGGHRSICVFAYAENVQYADLYVRTYPEFRQILKLTDRPGEGYKAIEFSETSLLITLGDMPEFTISVYNWRTGEKYTECSTGLILENQIIRCSWSNPVHVAQLATGSRRMITWTIFSCCGASVLGKHPVIQPNVPPSHSPKLTSAIFTTDDSLFAVDIAGNIYYVNESYFLDIIIAVNIEGTQPCVLTWYQNGLAVSGPNNQIRHYVKDGDWKCEWTFDLNMGVKEMISRGNEYLVIVSEIHEVVLVVPETTELKYLAKDTHLMNEFDDCCLIYPTCDTFAVLSHNNLTLYDVVTGVYVKHVHLSGDTSLMVENPTYPYIIIGYEQGYIDLMSTFGRKLHLMTSFNLMNIPIQSIQFFEQGKIFVVGNKDTGKFFIIEGLPGTKMNIVYFIDMERQIVDYMLVASKNCYRIFVIPVTSNHLAGNKIIRYCIVDGNINIKHYQLEDQGQLYYRIVASDKLNRDRIFYALSLLSRDIHVLETRRGDNIVRLNSIIKSGHQMRKINLSINNRYAITWGFDGFIFVRCKNFEKQVAMAVVHHRRYSGVKKAYIDCAGRYIISLGKENIVACTRIATEEEIKEQEAQLDEGFEEEDENDKRLTTFSPVVEEKPEAFQMSPSFELMFKRPTLGYDTEPRFKGKTWTEIQKLLAVEKEENQCRVEKTSILKELHDIQTNLSDLVTKNIEGPDNEKLDLVEFYLDNSLLFQKRNANKEKCKSTEIYLKALIEAQDRVSVHLKTAYLEPMYTKGRQLWAIFQPTYATSYTLLPPDEASGKRLKWIEEMRKVQQFLGLTGKFAPWIETSPEQLLEHINAPLRIINLDYTNVTLSDLEDTQRSTETQVAIVGTATQLYIERNNWHCGQLELATFYQCSLQQRMAEEEVVNLKLKYNEYFDAMTQEKIKEMDNVLQKNARLRHIISEYNYFSEHKIILDIEDPQWIQEEKPELIVQVSDNEISITPYISPSEQALLDARAAEEERIRLALLADDFRERALIKMMNGVLEIRWEDELKKDVPLPKCMIEKLPEDFNEDDIRAVREYDEKVVFLNSERERYRNILDADFTKTSVALRDSIRKFNIKLAGTSEFKLLIDSSMNQENLMINRQRQKQSQRINTIKTQEKISREIEEHEEMIADIVEKIKVIAEYAINCKNEFTSLQNKDKILEKAFKKDIQDCSPLAQDQAMKLYKRRPRVGYKNVSSFSELAELAKFIKNPEEKPYALTHESLEYIDGCNNMDHMIELPQGIDKHLFELICRHRRLKIDYEIQVRAIQLRLAFCEESINTLHKRHNYGREKIAQLISQRQQVFEDYSKLVHNIQIQTVLRRGLVEIPLSGDIHDFKDAILIPKSEIDGVNKLIMAAGEKKLSTIGKNMEFRRRIMATEWEHQKLRMIINDLIEQNNDINAVQLTKDMQLYLKNKNLGKNVNTDSYEQAIETICAGYEINVKDRKNKVRKILKQTASYRQKNAQLDNAIRDVNMNICDLQLQHNLELEYRETELLKSRKEILLKRSSLVRQIQKNHEEILVLQTELELLRLKTYPTFKYKLINPKE